MYNSERFVGRVWRGRANEHKALSEWYMREASRQADRQRDRTGKKQEKEKRQEKQERQEKSKRQKKQEKQEKSKRQESELCVPGGHFQASLIADGGKAPGNR